ncbi:isoleucine--tRNA ligase [Candidatus Chlorohelix sp.]|uniref:isoleucine--tRNA ligase n=1 Tax=Candidatus Chlorohelix sp. TaxID=3139201 RepID=UPI003028112D
MSKIFKEVDTKTSFPALEEEVLDFWQQSDIFKKSLEARKNGTRYVFYEGPPTANGRPGIHHVLARVFKDLFPRYKTMKGYYVPRRGGWDTHGLPVELEVEKKLGFTGKQDIEKYGIAEFNKLCKQSVWEYVQEWARLTERIGFWVDLENAYITYENNYIESCWWIMKTLWDKNLLFQDYKVTMHCPRCNTSLADHEVSQGFKDDVDDPSVYVRMRLSEEEAKRLPFDAAGKPVSFMIWTTTPWTLPANAAVALKADGDYVLADLGEECLIVAEVLAANLFGAQKDENGEERWLVRGAAKGSALVGFKYQPLYSGVGDGGKTVDLGNAYYTLNDEIVEINPADHDSTGLVHIAPAYGDLDVGRKAGLPTLFSVNLSGNVINAFPQFEGKFYKKADPDITRDLKERALLWKSGRVKHNYPFCWRCDTPLLYYAKSSWYIRTTQFKETLVSSNRQINWYPDHIREGRFGNWLENNVDWALSRERYWGCPMPIWRCDKTGQYECIGGVAELSQKTGRDLSELDLHRPYVDEVTYPSPFAEGGTMRRLTEVVDVWFESGAMPYAQQHYPFENQDEFAKDFPADYICEAVDQTRGWFYSLHALGVALFGQNVFKNVICLGHILDGEGQKMSKSKGNVVSPWDVVNAQGADALRWYLYTATPPGQPRRFSQDLVSESIRRYFLTLWNTYSFFVTYSNLDQPDLHAEQIPVSERPLIDRWCLSRLNALVRDVTAMMDDYDVTGSARAIENFVDDLSNWYVRRNRRRFWKSEGDADKLAAYQTLYTALVTVAKLSAPFTPFVSEALYRNLALSLEPNAPESVHLTDYPVSDESLIDEQLLKDTASVIKVVSLGRAARSVSKLKVRQPLLEVLVKPRNSAEQAGLERFKQQVLEELNVKDMKLVEAGSEIMNFVIKANFKLLGPKLGKKLPEVQKALAAVDGSEIAAKVKAGQNISVMLADGEMLELIPEEILVEAKQKEGYAVIEDSGYVVALNKNISAELKREGTMRDMVRFIQQARKDAGFNISDIISTYYTVVEDSDGTLADLSETLADSENARYIMSETLSSVLQVGDAPEGAFTQLLDIEGASLKLGLVKN